MRKIAVISFMFIFVLSSMAFAELKVGVVDMQKALDECDAGKAASKKIEQEYKEMQEKIQKKREDLQNMQTELNSQSGVLSEQAKQNKMAEYQDKLKDLKRMIEDSNAELQRQERSYVNRIAKELTQVVSELGKELKYDIIMEKQEAGIVHNSETVDITPIVIERYNKEWNAENN
ncbi:outer membrane chaperone Skp (OmpH) [Flexistipes sinusarabici DSM 4947]|uniref:Outer membrane chaperone Skp (OmpH) n=1 Tax=Flexistipes sinusarabici (strain ATCC 49648 / DSM 4947 / MAS 10) TaxID=717231 RepID=F8E4M1_FLESM|nr:OmpH family outer membrane protein [Flexistipes sinusarabici]AEI15579.1 outer membrane chaperone Skp (OmpH) [Flexistipes sinusarabici DSM 4947]